MWAHRESKCVTKVESANEGCQPERALELEPHLKPHVVSGCVPYIALEL